MKKMHTMLGLLLLLPTLSFADMTRVEKFHHQKSHHPSSMVERSVSHYHHRPNKLYSRPHRGGHLPHHKAYHRPKHHGVSYRYRDAYYQRNDCGRGYRVVDNSYYHDSVRYRIGERVRRLPLGARAVIIDNVRYYAYQNYYFLPQRRGGMRLFLVVDF